MARFTRRHLRQRAMGTLPAPPPQPEAPEEQAGSLHPPHPIRDPHNTVTRRIPTYARCMSCGKRDPAPRYHELLTMNPGDVPPVGITHTLCDECAARMHAAQEARRASED